MRSPSYPDPYRTAAAQSGADRDAALSSAMINNIDETSPFGSVNYTRNGEDSYTDSQGNTVTVPKYRRDVTLSQDQQDLYDRQNQAGKNLGDLAVSQSSRLNTVLNDPFDTSNLPGQASSGGIKSNIASGPSNQSRDQFEDAIMSRYDRLHDQARDAKETQLMNQGLTPGSTAWNNSMDELNRSRNDASMQAILASGQEQSRQVGLEINEGNFQNQAQNQQFAQDQNLREKALQEAFATRNQPINEVIGLMSGSQVTVPQFSSPYQQGVPSAPIGQYIQNKFAADMNNYANGMNGLFGLGASAAQGLFALSDARTKKNVSLLGRLANGLGVYLFKYRHSEGWEVGVMAQEALCMKPDAVVNIGGLLMVDYQKVAS